MTAEYLLLLAVSMMVMTVLFIAFSSFSNAAAEDACAVSARLVAAKVSETISEISGNAGITSLEPGLPDSINGKGYVIYPCEEGIAVQANYDRAARRYTAPLVTKVAGLRVEGFMVSPPGSHRIVYDGVNKTVTLS